MKNLKTIQKLLESCSLNMSRYKVPEPEDLRITSTSWKGEIDFFWNECSLHITDDSIMVFNKRAGFSDFKDLEKAFRKVVEYV